MVGVANSDRAEGLRVSQAEIEKMIAAAEIIRDCRRDLAARNSNLVDEVTRRSTICAWLHYPDGEVFDATSHAQYFFHAHAPDSRPPTERGHFHTFLRAEGMPRGVVPLLLPELAVADVASPPPQAAPLKRGERDEVSHLIAIAIDVRGEPVRLFTTNRWVTGETWYRAEDVIRMLDGFQVNGEGSGGLLNRWLTAMVQLFQPEIGVLLRHRDRAVTDWRWRWRSNVFEDPRLEITSSFAIDLDARLAVAEDRGVEPGFSAAAPAGYRLPRLAEGWGV